MSRFLFVLCMCWVVTTSDLAFCNQGAMFPSVVTPSLYIADVPSQMSQIRLLFFQENYFVLKKMKFDNGKAQLVSQLTGRWRQVGDGAHVQLTNAFGLEMILDVGSEGGLYGNLQDSNSFAIKNLLLRQVPYQAEVFRVSGILERRREDTIFTDSAADLSFSSVSLGEGIKPPSIAKFVEAEVSFSKGKINFVRILSESEKFPSSVRQKKQSFSEAVEPYVWITTPSNGVSEATCFFYRHSSAGGVLEVAGRGLRVELKYTVKKEALNFFVTTNDKKILESINEDGWLSLAQGPVEWRIEGPVLILCSQSGGTILLRKNKD